MRSRLLALSLIVLVAGTLSFAQEKSRGRQYAGARLLFSLGEVTVVYPAGAGENVELNRLSAQRRASYMEQTHGVRAVVVADDELGGDQRQGNLLLLGWNNRLLGTEKAPRPFEHSSSGLRFLKHHDPDPAADLLIYSSSPYNPDKFLVFWSRIDPGRDRFMVLPSVGSDWAIFHDFRVVLQGMFLPGTHWPPVRDPDAEGDHRQAIQKIEAGWTTEGTDHYLIFYNPREVSGQAIRRIAKSRERAFAKALGVLVENPKQQLGSFRILLHVYKDTEQKEQATGVSDLVHSLPEARDLHMVLRYAQSGSPHEEIHILARHILGPSYLTTLHEGLSLSVDGVYQGLPLDVHAALMLQQDVFPSLAALLDEERARALPEKVRFPASGMLVRWLRESANGSLPAKVYSLKNGSVEAMASTLGRPPEQVEAAFSAWLGKKAASRQDDLKVLEYEAMARERLMRGDYKGVAEASEKILHFKPDDPQTVFNLASALMRAGDYERAEGELKRLLESDPAESRFVVFGHYQLGRLYDIQGRRSAALARYRRVLELPDQHDAHRLAQEAIETPVTSEQLE